MVVTNTGKNRIRDLVSNDIYETTLGTGTTSADVGDTALQTPDATTTATPDQTSGNKLINSKHILLSTIGNGNTYAEIGIFVNNGTVLLSRAVFPDFNKTQKLELHSVTTYRIK